jgi:hypothetical protein
MATTNIQTFSGDVDVTSNILMSGEVFIKTNDGNGKVGIGQSAGQTSQGEYAVAVGRQAGETSQGTNTVAVGRIAGQTSQGNSAVAVGVNAGQSYQGTGATAVGILAGQTSQGGRSVAVGRQAGQNNQGVDALALGHVAGQTSQSGGATAVGAYAGDTNQSGFGVAVGYAAAQTSQGGSAVAVGPNAGNTSQGSYAVAVGQDAGRINQSSYCVSLGASAAYTTQRNYSVAIGHIAGYSYQNAFSVAVGTDAGTYNQGNFATATGYLAGKFNQGDYGTALGYGASETSQGNLATAVGTYAARHNQGAEATALGYSAGHTSQGTYATALGRLAGYTSQGDNAVAVGNYAGNNSQGDNAVAVGNQAGETSQGTYAVAVGPNAGNTSQGSGSVAVGNQTGSNNQGDSAVAVGQGAARFNQGSYATAVGRITGQTSQGTYAVAMGYQAGQSNQDVSAVAVGYAAAQTSQGNSAVAVGVSAGNTSQGGSAVAVGKGAGQSYQSIYAVAVGVLAGATSQGQDSVAVGNQAGKTSQGGQAVAVGDQAGQSNQGTGTVAIGREAGFSSQAGFAVAVGAIAGNTEQGSFAVAVGANAGATSQGSYAIAVGRTAGNTSQGDYGIAMGYETGRYNQGNIATAVGYLAGRTSQGANATAVGRDAGRSYQGTSAVAVGNSAGNTSQGASATAVGNAAGQTSQGISATAVGSGAGKTSQGVESVAMGYFAGQNYQGCQAIAVGRLAGQTSQGLRGIAIGGAASQYNQGEYGIGIGWAAGLTSQGTRAVAVGPNAGQTSQGTLAVAVGNLAGSNNQGVSAIAVGNGAGFSDQGVSAVAVGFVAGNTSQGASATAVGNLAGSNNQGVSATAVGVSAGQITQGASATALGSAAGFNTQGDNATAIGRLAGLTSQGATATAVGFGAGQHDQGNSTVAVGNTAGQCYQGTSAVAVGVAAGQTSQGIYTAALGYIAGKYSQGTYATALGSYTGESYQGSFGIAVGHACGRYNQGTEAIAIGRYAGHTSQGGSAVAVGNQAGSNNQGAFATAIGSLAGQTSQGTLTVAVGQQAGRYNQGDNAVAVGYQAGETSQGNQTIAMGYLAGETSQGENATAVGRNAGQTAQGDQAVAIGGEAGITSQGTYAVAVGYAAGYTSQGASATALGSAAGFNNQGDNATAIGRLAGETSQASYAVAVGNQAGQSNQGSNAVAVGYRAGFSAQGNYAVAVGLAAGRYSQGSNAIAVGFQAGFSDQGTYAVAMGYAAGKTSQGDSTVAVGRDAGRSYQGANATALGYLAGQTSQGTSAVAVGNSAGLTSQGSNAVAVGYAAGYSDQHDNSIVLNATGSILNTEGTGRTYIKPLRVATVASNVVTYDQTTGEVMDSGGLISNKLAIVSEQPPSALTGATTVVDGHGRYKVTASSEGSIGSHPSWQIFNKTNAATGGGYSSGLFYATTSPYAHTGGQSLGGVTGEWVQLELPYKTKLRHISLQSRADNVLNMPGAFSIIGSNDNTSWTTLGSFSGLTEDDYTGDVQKQFVVNATEQYKYYAIVVTNVVGNADNGRLILGEWRLFTETFTVDAGVVSTTAASGLDVGYTEHPVAPMTDYKTYVEGHGTYEASASSVNSTLYPWQSFDYKTNSRWATNTTSYSTSSPYENLSSYFTTDVGGTRYNGEWIQLKVPYPIVLSHSNVYPTGSLADRAPGAGVILGSNDGENWYKLTEFSGKTYTPSTWTRIDVNATTPYQYFRMCVTNLTTLVSAGGYLEFTEWRLFAEKPVTRMENVHISGDLSSETLQTGYIKWPKVPLKANDSEGYVASASSINSYFPPWKAFDGTYTDSGSWISAYPAYTADGYTERSEKITDVNGVDYDGEWIKIKLPQKIALHSYKLWKRNGGATREPSSGTILASNDDLNWYKLKTFTGLTYSQQDEIVDIQQSARYNHYALVIHTLNGGTLSTQISEIELFEAATGVGAAPTSAKLQVAGSLGMAKGAEFFAGDDVVMELPKHDRPLTKYPEVAMTADSSGGYSVNYSSRESATHAAYKAFDDLNQTNYTTSFSTDFNTFASGLAAISRTTGNDTFNHEYIQLNLPKPIHLKEIDIYRRGPDTDNTNQPKTGRVYGSNDGTTFDLLFTYSGLTYNGRTKPTKVINPNTTKQYYKSYRFVITEMYSGDRVSIGEMDFWGYEEGDTSVDVVHRSIPNKPGQQHLAVYWDANDSNSYSFANSSNVYDLSGNGVKGTITGTNGFDTEYNAWVFDGSGDYISGTQGVGTGQPVHSQSVWFKRNGTTGNYQYINIIGTSSSGTQSGFVINSDGKTLQTSSYGNDIRTIDTVEGQWYHAVMVYTGGEWTSSNVLTYVNGELAMVASETRDYTFSLTGTQVTLGTNTNGTEGFKGSIANFRLYSKVLNADQVRELYEYDAPRFGHRQNLVALHKGCLGVGVAHPTSRFEVAGADGVQEYPPQDFGLSTENYIPGHGLFRNYSSSNRINNGVEVNQSWFAFIDSTSYWISEGLSNDDMAYLGTSNTYTGTVQLASNIPKGNFIVMECPYAVNFKSLAIKPLLNSAHQPVSGLVCGSNDGNSWDIIHSWGYGTYGFATDVFTHIRFNTNVKSHRFVALVITQVSGGQRYERIGHIKYYGTPAPSALEDGHLTLGKALTLPRVSGHPAGAETPRAESLVVHYDTTVDSVVSGSTVVDISGQGANGTLNGDAAYSSTDRALVFDGTGDFVTTTFPSSAGDNTFSASFWVKRTANAATYCPFYVGDAANGEGIGMDIYTGNVYWFIFGGKNFLWTGVTDTWFPVGSWTHVAVSHTAGTDFVNLNKVWINGVEVTAGKSLNGTNTLDLNLDANDAVTLGVRGINNYLNGSISNFKLWNVALTAEEVAAEYALGRTGKSINLTDTALCLGGTVPRAQLDVRGSALVGGKLDVRGSALVGGNLGIGTTNPQAKLDTRGDAVFDTGKDDTTLTGLLNYSSTQSAIDAGFAAGRSGSISASTDINPPPGVAGDVIAKFVNSHTTEVITNQFTAPPLSITTGDVIYFGMWIYTTLDVSAEYFFFGPSGQSVTFTATGNSTWTWYEKTITSTSTTSSPQFRIDNNTAGRTYYFTGLTIRKNPSQTTGLPFTPRYSPTLGRGSVLSTQTLVAREAAIQTLTGNVGIGTTNPGGKLHVSGDLNLGSSSNYLFRPSVYWYQTYGGTSGYTRAYMEVNNTWTLNVNGNDKMYIRPDAGVVLNDFTGQHRCFVDGVHSGNIDDYVGLIVCANKNAFTSASFNVYKGNRAIQMDETLPDVSLSKVARDKSCFGVISHIEDEEKREDTYGSITIPVPKEVGDTRVYINSVGEGAMWVTDINGPLESGDYITTSNVAGYGQKQDSEFLANYTVAKITMDCDFAPATQPIQQIVKELANVNYWVKTTVSNVSVEEYSNLAEENRTTEDETYYTKDVERKFTYKPTITVTAEDPWDDVSIIPSDVTYAEWSNLEANVQNTYTLTYTQNDFESMRYEKTTVSNVTSEDAWDAVHIEPPTVTYAEYSNLEANVQNTFTLTYTKSVTTTTSAAYYSNLAVEDQELYTAVYLKTVTENVEAGTEGADAHVRTIYKKIEREETKEERDDEEWVLEVREELVNVLDEHGQLQWEDHPTETEKAYKIRYLDASGQQTDEANCVHKAAFVGVTYHCG